MAAHVNELLRLLVRAFHGPECAIVLDGLLRANRCIKDDELAVALKLQQKQVRKVLFELRNDHIVAHENRNKEALKQGERATAHLHWFVDYKNAVDCVKYRLHQISKKFNEEKEKEMQVQMYQCKQCKHKYPISALEAAALALSGWRCEHCLGDLEEISASESVSKTQNQIKTMWTQLKPLTDAMKRVEANPIPKFPRTAAGALMAGMEDESMRISTVPTTMSGGGTGGTGGGHARAATSTLATNGQQLDVFVDIVGASQNGTSSQGAQNGAAKPAPRAPLPWMQSSSQATAAATNTAAATTATTKTETATSEEMDQETYEQYVKQYLEEVRRQEELKAQEEQKKRKKGNGHVKEEPNGADTAQPDNKKVKKEAEAEYQATSQAAFAGEVKQEQEPIVEFEGEETAAATTTGEPMVTIGTQQIPISQITEEQQGQMTQEEYETYYQMYTSYYGTE